jgi:hypothetical protein
MKMSLHRRVLSTGAIVAVVVASGVAISPAASGAGRVSARPAAAKLAEMSFDPAIQVLKSSTHKKLQVGLFASETIETGGSGTSVSVRVSRKGVPEQHSWAFSLANGSLKFNPATGKGSIKSKKQLAPYAAVSFTFHGTGKKHVTTCKTEKSYNQTVAVSGSFSFDTRSGKHGWGKVKAKHLSGKTTIFYETGTPASCGGGFVIPCSAGISWEAFHSQGTSVNETSMAGDISTGKKVHDLLFADRNIALSKPKYATRSDTMDIPDNKMSLNISGTNKATLTVKGVGPITGSVTMASPMPGFTGSPEACGKGTHTQTNTSWPVTYKNGKSPLAVHEQIEGTYKVPNLLNVSTGEDSISKTVVN